MSDSAFVTAAYPGYTTAELMVFVAKWRNSMQEDILVGDVHIHRAKVTSMQIEIDRRALVEAGDASLMTPGERLRWVKALTNDDFRKDGIAYKAFPAARVAIEHKWGERASHFRC